MATSGFAGAPASRFLFGSLLSLSLTLAVVSPSVSSSIGSGLSFSRSSPPTSLLKALLVPVTYRSSLDAVVYSVTFYRLRALERIWGTRRFASTALSSFLLGYVLSIAVGWLLSILGPLVLIDKAAANFGVSICAGPIVPVMVLLYNYLSHIPIVYRYNVLLSFLNPFGSESGTASKADPSALTVSSNTFVWLPVLQVILAGLPSTIPPIVAAVLTSILLNRMGGAAWRIPESIWSRQPS